MVHQYSYRSLVLPLMLSFHMIGFAFAFQIITNNNKNNYNNHIRHNNIHDRIESKLYSSSNNLPSVYDISLPASLRGEAVRSALRSDRGTCIDFTSSSASNLNIGMVKVIGQSENVFNYLNNKLSNSFTKKDVVVDNNNNGETIAIHNNINNNKNENRLNVEYGQVKQAGLVTSKGRLIDNLSVLLFPSTTSTTISGNKEQNNNDNTIIDAYLVTTPGHSGSMLYDRLNPFIFPLDGVKLYDMCPKISGNKGNIRSDTSATTNNTRIFTIMATKLEHVQSTIQKNVLPVLKTWGFDSDKILFPENNNNSSISRSSNNCLRYVAKNSDGETMEMILYEQTFLPNCCCNGYTIVITANNMNLASNIWNNMIDANNYDGPVELGPLEYETLRIEAGVPAFGYEITGGLSDDDDDDDDENNSQHGKKANASPLELHLEYIVDETKGCYQGQEAISAQLNNKRGVPRNLYSVVFPEEDNFFDDQFDEEEYSNHSQRLSNKTKSPKPGVDLFVLGSNEQIKVGTLTSVAEKEGTSLSETVALALVRRSDPILKSMDDLGLEVNIRDNTFEEDSFWSEGYPSLSDDSGIINPIPLDPLDGLEVVIGDSFTQGYLRAVPSIRLRNGQNMFEIESWSQMEFQDEAGSVMGFLPQTDYRENLDNREAFQEMEQDTYEEEEEAIMEDTEMNEVMLEAQRKEEKMKLLQKRAEEAMARRRQKQNEIGNAATSNSLERNDSFDNNATIAAAAEAERKEKKMQILKERAEAAMKRRQQKNQ